MLTQRELEWGNISSWIFIKMFDGGKTARFKPTLVSIFCLFQRWNSLHVLSSSHEQHYIIFEDLVNSFASHNEFLCLFPSSLHFSSEQFAYVAKEFELLPANLNITQIDGFAINQKCVSIKIVDSLEISCQIDIVNGVKSVDEVWDA